MKPSILKRDLWQVGLLIGLALPTLSFIVLYAIDLSVFKIMGHHITKQFHYLLLLSMASNLFPLRHYLIKLKFEKTGIGIMLVTIAIILTYFYLFYQP